MINFHDHKKPWGISLVILCLSLLICMFPGVHNNLSNSYGIIFGMGSLAILLPLPSLFKPWSFLFFLSGMFLIINGILFFATGNLFVDIAQKFFTVKKIDELTLKEMTMGMSLWIYFIPVVSIGVGINIISLYLSTEKVTNDTT